MSNRTEELAYYRNCDERIAAEWSKYYDIARARQMAAKEGEKAEEMVRYYANRPTRQRYYAERAAACETRVAELTPLVDAARKAAVALDAELYTGWSRFFLVKHIHSSQSCSSFRPTTRIGWLPKVSGLTEVEAVGEYGETLCTICYPSAPTELTTKQADPSLCSGSGKYHSTEHLTGRENAYSSPSGYCPDCLRWNTVTKTGVMRKHKVDITKRHATQSAK